MNNGQRYVSRSTSVDSLGNYYLSAVPVGSYTLTVTDPRTSATVSQQVTVASGQSLTRNMSLLGVSQVRVSVRFAGGADAGGIPIRLVADAVGYERYEGLTDVLGKLALSVPMGAFKVMAHVPEDVYNRSEWVEASGTVTANNETLDITLTLKAHGSVRARVIDLDAGNAVLPNAVITLVDSACPSGCQRGSTAADGQYLVTNVHAGAYSIKARAADGRFAQYDGVLTTADDGKTLAHTLGMTALLDTVNLHSFVGENQLYSVKVNAGDIISVGINGVQVNGQGSAYLTRARVYAPDKTHLASGYGYDSRNGNAQYNEQGNLLGVAAAVAGNYPITVSPYYSGTEYLGGFRLQVKVNGVAVAITPYQDGGVVQGMVTKADNTAASGHQVELQTFDPLAMRVRVSTDTLGAYSVAGVPLADFKVSALDPATKLAMVSDTGRVETVAALVEKHLALPKRTTVQLQVAIAGALSVPGQMYVTVSDALGQHQDGPLTFTSGALSDVRDIVVYGDQATITARHPSNGNATASAVVQGAHGQSVPLTLTLAFTGVQGTLYNSAGGVVAGTYVQAHVLSTRRNLGATYSDGAGQYSFGALPVGEEILVQAVDAQANLYVGARTTLRLNQANVLDIRFPGVGQVTGRVTSTDGEPLSGAWVSATYVYDELNGYTTYVSASTAADGSYTLSNAPVALPLQVRAEMYGPYGQVSAETSVTLQTAGQSGTANLVLPVPTGSLLVRLAGADGVPFSASLCYEVQVAFEGQEGNMNRSVCGAETIFANLAAGQGIVSVYGGSMGTPQPVQFTVVDGQRTELVVVVSVVKGSVRFSDGTPVPYPSVSVVTAGGDTLFAYETSVQGEYRILGVPVGPITVKAEDPESALYQSVTAHLVSATEALTQDVTLPRFASVSGVYRDDGGAVVANADVYVRSSAIDVDRYGVTDENGRYRIGGVALGSISVLGRDPATGLIATGEGVLGASDIEIDLVVPASTPVSGTLTSDGVPVPEVEVSLSTVRTFGPFGPTTLSTITDADGRYSFAAVPVGLLRVSASMGNQSASALGTALAGAPLTLFLQMGGVVDLGYTLSGSDSSRYDVSCRGMLDDGGFGEYGDAYDGAYALSIGEGEFPCSRTGELRSGAREVAIGPYEMKRLYVTRRIYVPAGGGYARYLDSFVNPTSQPVTVTVVLNSNLGSDNETRVAVAPAATGGRYAVTTDSGYDPALGHVFASAAAELMGNHSVTAPSDDVTSSWTFTVPAGETVSLMHFAIQRTTRAVAEVTQQAEALSNMTQAGMFNGLSASEKLTIKNFKVNP